MKQGAARKLLKICEIKRKNGTLLEFCNDNVRTCEGGQLIVKHL